MSFDDDTEIVISISEQGATATDIAVKKVTRSIDGLKLSTANPIGVNLKPTDFSSLFNNIGEATAKIKQLEAAHAAMLKEFSKAAKVTTPQVHTGDRLESASSAFMNSPLARGIMPEESSAGSRMASFSAAAMATPSAQGMLNPSIWDKFRSYASGGAKSAQDFAKAANEAKESTNRMEGQLKSTTGYFTLFGRIVAISLLSKATKEIISLADAFTNLQNKIRVVIPDQDSLNVITGELVRVANESRTSIGDVATVFSRTSRSVEALGKSQAETLVFTETLQKAIQVGGSTAVEASNAAIQLSQGLASGALKGDELRSVLEQLPVVAQLIADKFGVGVGALRKMGELGKLTAEQIFDGISEASDRVQEKFSHMNITFEQAWERFNNAALVASQKFQHQVNTLSSIVINLAEHFDTLVTLAESLATVIAVALVSKALSAAIVGFKALAVEMSTVGGFFGVIATTIVYVTAALVPFIEQMQIASDGTATWGDLSTALWETWTEGLASSSDPLGTMGSKIIGLGDNTKRWLVYLGEAIDAFNYINPAAWVQAAVSMGELTPIGNHGGRDMMKKVINRADNDAMTNDSDRMLQEEKDALARDMMFDHPEKKKLETSAKAGKMHGHTFEYVLEELQRENAISKMPDWEQSTQKEGVQRMGTLNDNVLANLTDAQVTQLHDLIQQSHDMQDAVKLIAEVNKEITDEKKKMIEKGIGAGQHEQDLHKQAALALEASDRNIQDSLDPLKEYNDEVAKLEGFDKRTEGKNHQAIEDKIAKMSEAYQTFAPIMEGINQSVSDAAANALVFGDNMSQALDKIAKSLASQLISSGLQLGIKALTGGLGGPAVPGFGGGPTPELPPVPSFQLTPLGNGASGGYFPGFSSGGYTGYGNLGDVAGVVHNKEYVVNANATARNRATLEAMNAGHSIGNSPNIQIHNYAGVEVEAQMTRGEIQVMIRRGVQEHAPAVIAGDMRNTNSRTSKALNQSLEATRRR